MFFQIGNPRNPLTSLEISDNPFIFLEIPWNPWYTWYTWYTWVVLLNAIELHWITLKYFEMPRNILKLLDILNIPWILWNPSNPLKFLEIYEIPRKSPINLIYLYLSVPPSEIPCKSMKLLEPPWLTLTYFKIPWNLSNSFEIL